MSKISAADRWGLLARQRLFASGHNAIDVAAFVALCAKATSAQPTFKWIRQRDELVARFPGAFDLSVLLLRTFLDIDLTTGERAAIAQRTKAQWAMFARMRSEQEARTAGRLRHLDERRGVAPMQRFVDDLDREVKRLPPAPKPGELFSADNADLARGAAWVLSSQAAPGAGAVALLLGDVAFHGIAVNRGVEVGTEVVQGGKVVNACVTALQGRGDEPAIVQLGRLAQSVHNKHHRKVIDRALATVAAASGLTVELLLESLSPKFDLDADGTRVATIDGVTARIRVTSGASVVVTWERPGAEKSKSVPKNLPVDARPALKDLQTEIKRLKVFVKAEQRQLERMLADPRPWDFKRWSAKYVEHPVVGRLGRGMIWWCEADGYQPTRVAVDADGNLTTVEGSLLDFSPDDVSIRLWHPVDASPDDGDAWEKRLAEFGVAPAVPQVGRDVYRVGPEDGRRRDASARFALKLLDYKPLRALMRRHEWSAPYLGAFDSGQQQTAARLFEGAGIAAKALLVATEDPAELMTVDDCAFEPVRFVSLTDERAKPIPLDSVPPAVFSETMHDLHLFTAKCAKSAT